jgi:hypothetical protein
MNVKNGSEKLARALLLPINPAAIIILGIFTVLWGLWLANPFWTVFTQAALYSVLSSVAPEWFWGCLAIVCGSFTIYGAVRRRYRPLINGAVISVWHWLMISIFYFMGDPLNTGGITALTFCVYAGFIYLNLRVNYKDNKESEHFLHHE